MEVNAATGVPTTAAEKSRVKLADDFDNFLTLLTAQLAHQDPLDPVDSNEFVAQLVSFTEVEQSIASNRNLETLISLFSANQSAMAVGYLGTTVEAVTNTAALEGGEARFIYNLPEATSEAKIVITNAEDEIVYTGKGNIGIGDHRYIWRGIGNDGSQQPDGIYRISISAKNSDGDAIEAATRIVGRVTGVNTAGDDLILVVNGVGVSLDDIVSVQESEPPPAA